MKKIISLILSIQIYSGYTFAECSKPVTYLQEGTPAICSGYLFTPEKELDVRLKITNYEKLELIIKKQDELVDVLNKRIEVQLQQNKELNELIATRENETFLHKALFFGLGAVLTGLISYGTIQAIK